MSTEKQLKGKVALVTGGSRGIGAAIAKRLAADGASVAVTYTSGKDAAESVVQEITKAQGKAIAIKADAVDAAAVEAAVKKTVEAFGRLDILVNNAGVFLSAPIETQSLEQFDKIFDVNVRSIFVATKAAVQHIKEGGRIINIGSVFGERAYSPGLATYAASKGAVKMYTQGLARELGTRGITVNNVEPGPVDTDMNPASGSFADFFQKAVPAGRYGRSEEIASLVAVLAAPSSAYINGGNIAIDGGMLA